MLLRRAAAYAATLLSHAYADDAYADADADFLCCRALMLLMFRCRLLPPLA